MNEEFYYTIAQPVVTEFKDRGSRFLAYAYPLASVDDFKAKMKLLKEEHPKAVHHCFAYRLGVDGNTFRVSDDGEPSGSAGRPILGQIDSKQLCNVLVVVVRYFGGTLLGVPGLINAYNFMDGINGITGLYFLVFFGSFMAINQYMPLFDSSLTQYILLSILVFLVFNLRKKALMFAGDIGSISIAYLVIYFLAKWFLASDNWTIILLLLIYGADSFLTLGQRLLRGENVALPHRSHLYQLMVNQLKKDHVSVSLVFAFVQLLLNFVLFIYPQTFPSPLLAAIVLVGSALVYLMIKIPIQKKFNLL